MAGRTGIRLRYALALVLLCAILCGQSAALTSVHQQHKAQDAGCLVCMLGSMPFLGPTAAAPVAQILLLGWLGFPPDLVTPHDARLTIRSSRAPPA